ncbi:putative B6 ABC transporter ATP-binding protein [Dongia rigui]|uniref:ABC transporter ATP-binding protein n=1 Tax=Dongia rigui TaxID=940149 RepID=A0ABU5DZ65_9PROT|nr:ABC transporter ATP-binding protein [Dongia rigui]MDY0872624.1 ABC transporter ATP-binding protein [Dongia rigui]
MASDNGQPRSNSATGADSAPVLSVHALTKRFPGIVANDQISLDFHAGEIHILLGENGAGKSTLIGMLAGMQSPDAGEIRVGGEIVQIKSPREALNLGIGTVFQHVLLVPSLSVIENLMLGGAWWQRLARGSALARFAELSGLLGVTLDPNARLGSLSLGQQQQVEIMRALWREARLLILDEPTSMLTPQGVKDLAAVLRRLRDKGVAIILVTHKLGEATDLGDRISVLRHGQLVGAVAPADCRSWTAAEVSDRVIAMMFGGSDASAERAIQVGSGEGHASLVAHAGAPCLQVSGLTTAAERGACPLRDVTLDLWPGEVLGIAGVDGNGQKHLAETLAGQRAASSGTIRVDGKDVTGGDVAARRQVGIRYVTDDRLGEGTVGSLSVAVNLLLKDIGRPPFWRHGIADRARIRAAAVGRIEANDIRTRAPETPLGKLSGGNIQKVLLARELGEGAGAAPTRVIIFAKPTHGLDLQNAELAHDRIRQSAAAGQGILLLSTDLDELLGLSDRIAVLVDGRVVGIVANGAGAGLAVGRLMTGAAA